MCSSRYHSRFPAALLGVTAAALLPFIIAASCIRLIAGTQYPETAPTGTSQDIEVSILVYHRFGPFVKDAMTVRTATFRWQLDYLEQNGYTIIPLRALVSYLSGRAAAPPRRSIVITADDGHASVFTEMLPVVREHRVPVTLFVYPSAISNATYAMTWEQLDALHRTGLFDIGSHSYWHPNFKTEKERLSPAAYRAFAMMQLVKSRDVLKNKLRVQADVIAWPFGIYDDELIAIAREAGYLAGVTLERRVVTRREPIMALPRFLVTDGASGARFGAMLPDSKR
jgi:peptidoglycan/xylan/chitin deacetylase (PgdA/CDA1 family)